ncbi:MAG: sarcosine oxidase subunit alpha [Gammaproteobacteria bacterium]|jgi:sarcosine oxidase subunit alpha
MEAGKAFDIRPFGVEAQRLLRLEKGPIIIGQDTDGLTFPAEANMSWAIAGKKSFHIGKRSTEIQSRREQTRSLVGFTLPAHSTLPREANLTLKGNDIAGRITSVAHSTTLNKIIGLTYVLPEQSEVGTSFDIKLSDGSLISIEVVSLPFYDHENLRQGM